MLAVGESVAVTHVTFLNATPETLEHIRTGNYTLILDEALDVVCEFNKATCIEENPRQFISEEDLSMLFSKGMIEVVDGFKVVWRGGEYGIDFKFYEVMKAAKLGRLYYVRNKLLITIYPPEMFRQFEQTYVLTYMLEASLLKPYFELFGLDYTMASVKKAEDAYELTDYSAELDAEFRRLFKENVHICDCPSLNRSRTLSKSWYMNAGAEQLAQLKRDLENFFGHKVKGASTRHGDIMWTCPSDFEDKLAGKGYTGSQRLSEAEKNLPEQLRKEIEKQLKGFVPCNAKATNMYRNRWALAYCCNMFYSPLLRGFFIDCGITPDDDAYATSCLIQWICRSRIRDGQPIELYLPSRRMRNLLLRWIG